MAHSPQNKPDAGDVPTAAEAGPRTARGRRTRRALLDAAAQEFGAHGFHATGISDITRGAGVALGSFYTYFPSKEEIFRAVVSDLSAQVRDHVAPAVRAAPDGLAAERAALQSFLAFVREKQLIYRIIDEAEFVAPDSYREHYASTVERITQRLQAAAERGEVRPDVGELEAWALVGMNVFLGLRYGVWGQGELPEDIATAANRLIVEGLKPGAG
ncbi:MAG: TetR/AcrR family transcriptional regulator [Thermaurantiacus sp.]